MSERVLILGANGWLGRTLVTAFAEAGWTVLAQARRPLDFPVAGDVRTLLSGVTEPDRLAAAARGADVVVHAMNAHYTRWASDAMPPAHAAIAITRRLDATLIFAGNVYNFGSPMPAVRRGNALQLPSTRKGRIRAQTESLLRDRPPRGCARS